MSLRQTIPPSTLPITLEEAKAHLRVDDDESDALIEALIWAALAVVEKDTGRALEPQTWTMTLDRFPTAEIHIPMGPITGVTSVVYADPDGVPQIMDPTGYVVDTASADGWVLLAADGAWPTPLSAANAVTVTFTAGSGTPEDIKHAIKLMIGLWYDTRATASTPEMREIPMGAERLIHFHRRVYI